MAIDKKKLGRTLIQILVGCGAGLLAGWISLTLINFVWQGLEQLSLNNFLTGLLLLISFLIVLGATVAATAEGVRFMGRFIPREVSRRRIYEGSFLGICAVVAMLSVTRGDWISTLEDWSGPIRLIATLLYFAVVLPVKLVTFWLPALLMLFIAAPIGAAIGYNLPPHVKKKSEIEHSESKESGKRKS